MQSLVKQRGLSPVGWLALLSMIGAILIFFIKSLPVYMSHYQVYTALEWAANQPELSRASAHTIRKRIERKFDTGYVRHIGKDDIKIRRKAGGVRTLGVKYEVRKHLFYNIELLFSFDTTVVMKREPDAAKDT